MWWLTPVVPGLLDDEAGGSQKIESSLLCTAGPGGYTARLWLKKKSKVIMRQTDTKQSENGSRKSKVNRSSIQPNKLQRKEGVREEPRDQTKFKRRSLWAQHVALIQILNETNRKKNPKFWDNVQDLNSDYLDYTKELLILFGCDLPLWLDFVGRSQSFKGNASIPSGDLTPQWAHRKQAIW